MSTTPIQLRVNPETNAIEYKIGHGKWIQHGNPYFTYAGAEAARMILRERTRHGLTESMKELLGVIDE